MKPRRAATASALVLLLVPRLGGTPPCQEDVHLIFQAEPAGSTWELFFGTASEVTIGVPPALPVARHTAAAAVVSNLGEAPGGGGLCRGNGCSGVQGWSVSIALEGDLKLVHATVQDANPRVVCSGAFIVTHLVDPERPGPGGGPQGQGVISAVAFICGDLVTLQPHATDTVLGITVEAPRPATGQSVSGKLLCRDGLAARGAQPVPNIATIGGHSLPFCTCSDLTVRFEGLASFPFRRCDTDGSGRLEVSDAISFLSWLFLRGAAPACAPAADCDGDQRHSVTDAIRALFFLFGGGAPPPLPFPDCGFAVDPTEACTTQTGGCPA